jgi:hypothetical protein
MNGEHQIGLWKCRQSMGTNIQVLPRKLAANSLKYNISQFHLNPVGNGNDDISSEEDFLN